MLFLIYVNDMSSVSSVVKCKLLLYADDSALIVLGNDVYEMELTRTIVLDSIRNWLIDSKLSLYLGKTESILFGTKIQRAPQVKIATLASKSSVKYLGVELDQHIQVNALLGKLLVTSITKLGFYTIIFQPQN